MPSKRSTNESLRSALTAIREPLIPKFSIVAPPSSAPRCEVQEISLPPPPHPLSPQVVESPKQQMVDSLKFFVSIFFSSPAHRRSYRYIPFIRNIRGAMRGRIPQLANRAIRYPRQDAPRPGGVHPGRPRAEGFRPCPAARRRRERYRAARLRSQARGRR